MVIHTSQINEIIIQEQITAHYQPIISLHNGEIIGYEALSRGPVDTPFHSPLALIEAAEAEGCVWELEMLFRKKAIENAITLPSNRLLFLNVDPNVFREPSYTKGFTKKYLEKYRIDSKNIVFEITERTAIEDYATFTALTSHYKSQNYKIAIDDMGSGYSGLKTISEVKPEYVKLDMDLIRNIDSDSFKQSMIKALVSMAKETHIKLIAEGVETIGELEALIKLDVYAAQGFLLSRPSQTIAHYIPEVRDLILQINRAVADAFSFDAAYYCVGKIAKQNCTYYKSTSCCVIKDIMEREAMDSICLISKGRYPEGIIMKNYLNSKLADRYGFDLYSHRPVELLMDARPLMVDYYTPVTKVLTLAMQRAKENLYDDVIVTQCSRYFGITTIYDLIRNSTEYEKLYAKQQNPLTSLPGNIIIRQMMEQYISNGEKVGILYIDLDHFKAYNDVYGFEKGDHILKTTANIIVDIINKHGNIHFVGHIGGDDFVALVKVEAKEVEAIGKEICETFDSLLSSFFSKEDYLKGCYISKDRYNNQHSYPLNSISIAAYHGALTPFKTPENLGEFMSELKRQVKAIEGSVYKLVV
jgi:diguanylate cyclase (GGDEF)-like protein